MYKVHYYPFFLFLKTDKITQGSLCNTVSKESACNAGDPSSNPGSGNSPGQRIGYPLQYTRASLVAHLVKNLLAGLKTSLQSLGWENSPGGGQGNPFQYFCLENPQGQRTPTVHGIAKSWA